MSAPHNVIVIACEQCDRNVTRLVVTDSGSGPHWKHDFTAPWPRGGGPPLPGEPRRARSAGELHAWYAVPQDDALRRTRSHTHAGRLVLICAHKRRDGEPCGNRAEFARPTWQAIAQGLHFAGKRSATLAEFRSAAKRLGSLS